MTLTDWKQMETDNAASSVTIKILSILRKYYNMLYKKEYVKIEFQYKYYFESSQRTTVVIIST